MNDQMTAAQRAAIETAAPQVAVVAGPGSGKTTTIVERIRRLTTCIDTRATDPREIVAITFTNAAARELEERLAPIKLGHCGTLHSFAMKIVRGMAIAGVGGYTVISPESAVELLALKAKALGCRDPIKKLLVLKAAGVDASKPMDLAQTTVASFLGDLKADGILDYDILLTECEAVLHQPASTEIGRRFTHLFVDEAQDSAPIDWRIYTALPIANKTFIGDPDQAIYGFRGGRVAEMLHFMADRNAEIHALEENFRSGEEICAAAQRLIEHNVTRWQKTTRSATPYSAGTGQLPEAANEGEEIGIVSRKINELIQSGMDPNEIAVLARTNAIANNFLRTLDAIHIPVCKRAVPDLPPDFPLARATVELLSDPDNDTLAYLFLAARGRASGKSDITAKREAREKVIEATARGKTANALLHLVPRGTTAVDAPQIVRLAGGSLEAAMWLAELARLLPAGAGAADLSLAAAAPEIAAKEEGEGVHVLTMHAAKGREFDAVFVVGMEEETVPGRRKDADIEEERRIVYVASTRARRFLAFSCCRSRVTPWGMIVPTTPSRFLAELASHPTPNTP